MQQLRLLGLLALLLGLTSVQAQWSLGLRGGYLRAWQDYGNFAVPEGAEIHLRSLRVAAQLYRQLSPTFSWGLEPGLARRGAACIPGFNPWRGDTRLFLHQAELPLMLRAHLPLGPFELQGRLGYGASLLLGAAQQRLPAEGPGPVEKLSREAIDIWGIRRWDHGLHAGVGMAWRQGNHQLTLTSNYYYGLLHAVRRSASRNRGLSLELGYAFHLEGS